MRLQHKSDKVINDKAEPDIKEINDKKLIEIIYPLTYNDIENSMSNVYISDSNLSSSEDNEED